MMHTICVNKKMGCCFVRKLIFLCFHFATRFLFKMAIEAIDIFVILTSILKIQILKLHVLLNYVNVNCKSEVSAINLHSIALLFTDK